MLLGWGNHSFILLCKLLNETFCCKVVMIICLFALVFQLRPLFYTSESCKISLLPGNSSRFDFYLALWCLFVVHHWFIFEDGNFEQKYVSLNASFWSFSFGWGNGWDGVISRWIKVLSSRFYNFSFFQLALEVVTFSFAAPLLVQMAERTSLGCAVWKDKLSVMGITWMFHCKKYL